jgi:transposase
MRRNSRHQKASAEKVVKDIRRATRRQFGAEEKIRIVLDGCPASAPLGQMVVIE